MEDTYDEVTLIVKYMEILIRLQLNASINHLENKKLTLE